MAKDRWSRKRFRLLPRIFLHVINLHVIDWPIFRATADNVDITVVRHPDHRLVDRHGNVGSPVPPVLVGQIGIHVSESELVALTVNGVSTKNQDLASHADRRRTESSCNAWNGSPF